MNKEKITNLLMTSQFLINFAVVSFASLFGGYAEALAHVRAGNGVQIGIILSFISIAALTMAALTKSKIAWGLYFGQLIVGLSQFVVPFEWSAIPNALLSLSSGVAAYAAANMLSFSIESQQEDKSADRDFELRTKELELEHELKRQKLSQQHEQKLAKQQAKSEPQNDDSYSDSQLWTMKENGKSLRKIASETGIPYSTVRRKVNQFEPPSEPVIHLNGTGV